jgi:hypothetical protein
MSRSHSLTPKKFQVAICTSIVVKVNSVVYLFQKSSMPIPEVMATKKAGRKSSVPASPIFQAAVYQSLPKTPLSLG